MKKSWEGGISVVIPTFNRAQYLYATLICLCNQKVAENVNYEIIGEIVNCCGLKFESA